MIHLWWNFHGDMTRLSAWLVIPPWPRLLTLCLFAARWLLYLFSTDITSLTALMNWPPVFHLQRLSHVPHSRQHLPTNTVWNSPMWELISSVMVTSLLLSAFGTLSLHLHFHLHFQLPSTFLPSKGKSITTLGTRWHDFFFITLFRYFINLFHSFHYLSFPFLKGSDSRKGTLCPFCVPIHKKKKSCHCMIRCVVACAWWRSAHSGWFRKCNGDFRALRSISCKIFMKMWLVVTILLTLLRRTDVPYIVTKIFF